MELCADMLIERFGGNTSLTIGVSFKAGSTARRFWSSSISRDNGLILPGKIRSIL